MPGSSNHAPTHGGRGGPRELVLAWALLIAGIFVPPIQLAAIYVVIVEQPEDSFGYVVAAVAVSVLSLLVHLSIAINDGFSGRWVAGAAVLLVLALVEVRRRRFGR